MATALAALVIAGVVVAAPTGASAKNKSGKLPFRPGTYKGFTTQTCIAVAAEQGLCQEGQRVPISFRLTRTKALHIKTAVINRCEDGTTFVMPLEVKSSHIVRVGRRTLIQGFKQGNGVKFDLQGRIAGHRGYGLLTSYAFLGPDRKPDEKGELLCKQASHWRARRG